MTDSICSLIGIAYRVGKIVSGYEHSLRTLQRHKGKLILLALDASIQTKSFFYTQSKRYNMPLYETSFKDDFGKALGKTPRAVVICTDAGFAKAIVAKLTRGDMVKYEKIT